MFPSNNSFPFDSNLNSTQPQSLLSPPPPSSFSFFHFPPPFEDNNGIFFPHPHDHHFSFHNHHQSQPLLPDGAGIMEISRKPNNDQIPTKNKRICKRDRHSKIKTAKGLRDRRMRLSLEVAKRFFGLQDILGFDKASKTVEWLLNQSKDEIKQLAMDKNYNDNDTNNNCSGVVKSASSTSECEGVSGLDDVALSGMNDNQDQQEGGDHHQSSLLVTMTATKRRSTKSTRKSPLLLDPLIARESREKARERARERTKQKQKMKMKSSRKLLAEADVNETTNHNCNLTQFGSWNPFETGEKVRNPTLEVNVMDEAAKEDEPNSQSNDDDPLAANMIFNSLNTTSTFLQDQHHFAEFQSLSKFWEVYNSHHMI